MHAIILQGDGQYYVSAVFGYYRDITATESYAKYLEQINKPYWIVWDAQKKRLIRWKTMVSNTKYLTPQILIIDSEHDNWNVDEDGVGCVNFLTRELLDSFLDKEEQPEDILYKCRQIDEGYTYEEIREIKTDKNIEDLDWVSGGFHDAFIVKQELQDDGSLYLLFDGIWSCKLEVWFWGDLEYDTSCKDPENFSPYWDGATVIIQDGFIYLADEEELTVEEMTTGYCFFKARHMKYRIIPNL